MKKNNISGYIATALISAGVTAAACWFGFDYSRRDAIKLGEALLPAKECETILKAADYPIGSADPVRAAIAGYISALSTDKYTHYTVGADENDEMTAIVNSSGTALASGFQVDIADDGNILITDVTKGFAADRAGLRPDDVITAINGVSVAEESYANIVEKLLGKQDTEVLLTVRRDGSEQDINFKRDHEYRNLAYCESRGDVAYIRLSHFSTVALGQFDEALDSAAEKDKWIIDLRNNSGGDTKIAVTLSAQLCGQCRVELTPYSGETEVIEESGKKGYPDKKIIILINEKTASSAEIMAAAAKQELDVKLVGTTTFGKGVYQKSKKLENGDKFRYTAGTYTVGDWECYQGKGISPDVELAMDSSLVGTDNDIQLKKALELLE